jgi:hypothetical protein
MTAEWLKIIGAEYILLRKIIFLDAHTKLTLVRHDGNYRFLFVEIPNWGLKNCLTSCARALLFLAPDLNWGGQKRQVVRVFL